MPMTPPTTVPTPGATAGTGASATAGAPGMMAAATAGTAAPAAGAAGGGAMPMMPPANADPRGMCPITTKFPDDRACVLAPAPEEGMQIHVGPKDYENASETATFIMQPGGESSECWTFHTPNEKEIQYQTYMLSGRAGTHHIINTMYRTNIPDGGFTGCADPGIGASPDIIDNIPGASKAYMPRGIVAPENEKIARKIPAKATTQADMHYFNFTDKPILREFWMNVYFVDPAKIEKTGDQIRAMGGLTYAITPGTDRVYKYECPMTGNGRIMALLGHYHSHGKRFTAHIRRAASGMTEKVFEMYDYQDPAQFEYDTVQKNPMFSTTNAGAVSGMLEVKNGDVLMWECHIVNDSSNTLTYTNMVKTGEMCNLWGSSIDIDPVNCVLF